ncbi:hypothetical protein CN918_32555 [Priestia megaterium]|nr:hypothetical protein CN918_32555 [Priestia megaterium]
MCERTVYSLKITKTFSYKLKPTKDQSNDLQKTLAATTFCYNLFLHYNKLSLEKIKKKLDLKEMLKQLPSVIKKYQQLKGVSTSYLNSTVVDLFFSLKPVYRVDSLPSFKKQGNRIILLRDFLLDEANQYLKLPAIGSIAYIQTRHIKGVVKALHLVYKFNGWYVDVVCEQHIQPKNPQTKPRFLGIDVGLNDFAILSNGMKIDNPRFYRTLEDKLKTAQKSLSRKQRHSSNWHKQLKKVQSIHKHIYHARMNFLHQLTTYLTDEFDVLAIEKLPIQEMKRNRKFAKSIQDASWGTFVKLLKYKATEKGKTIVEVDRYFPSTKTCSRCGHKEIIPLHLRTFTCTRCHLKIHRDYNAALNLEQKAVHHAFVHNLSDCRG